VLYYIYVYYIPVCFNVLLFISVPQSKIGANKSITTKSPMQSQGQKQNKQVSGYDTLPASSAGNEADEEYGLDD
jgi:hypothetical protein